MEYSYADNKPQSIYNVNYTIFCVCFQIPKKWQVDILNADYSYLSVYGKVEYFYIQFWTGTCLKMLPTKKNLLNISLL